jgi:site-specific DNA recombinase
MPIPGMILETIQTEGDLEMDAVNRKRMVGYVRVSTDEQASSGLGLEAQMHKIHLYCELHGYEIVEIVSDRGFSGKNLDRPGMKRVLEMMAKKEVDGVVIARLDRITRSVRDMDYLVRDVFSEKNGRILCSATDSFDTSSASGRLIIGVLTQVAQWEREIIVERTVDALKQKKARGERTGNIPYGKKLDDDGKTLVDHIGERLRIRQMAAMRADGMTYRAIADKFNEIGIRTKNSGRVNEDGSVIQGKWTANRVMDILRKYDQQGGDVERGEG